MKKKVMIITGSSKGIGKSLAEHYLKKEWIVAGCSRGEGSINHDDYEHFNVDVSDEQSVVEMVRRVYEKFNKIDVLLNNAGIATMNAVLLSSLSKAESIMRTNFLGAFLFCREVGKAMIRKKTGSIVNFTSVASPLNLEGEALYASSKASVERLTKILAYELGSSGVTVNAIGPTPIDTDLIGSVPEDKIHAVIQRQAVKRKGSFDDIAHVCDFLIDEKSSFVTGQVIYLGGVCD
ncbi:MAG: SDR family oxidoreductase [Opitutales bacterium]|tara:strand:- start:1035 stop:1739 length:705 start_codon:yes stop_codon:yes gene_type:complete